MRNRLNQMTRPELILRVLGGIALGAAVLFVLRNAPAFGCSPCGSVVDDSDNGCPPGCTVRTGATGECNAPRCCTVPFDHDDRGCTCVAPVVTTTTITSTTSSTQPPPAAAHCSTATFFCKDVSKACTKHNHCVDYNPCTPLHADGSGVLTSDCYRFVHNGHRFACWFKACVYHAEQCDMDGWWIDEATPFQSPAYWTARHHE